MNDFTWTDIAIMAAILILLIGAGIFYIWAGLTIGISIANLLYGR